MQLYQLSFPNGKSYIGITSKTAKERFAQHCKLSQKNAVHFAIQKYGKENVVLTVLATVDNWELLCLAEQEAIDKYKTFGCNGYNLTLGGEGVQKVGIYGDERIARNKKISSTTKKSRYLLMTDKEKEKERERLKKYREENKEYLDKKSKKYRIENKDKIAERMRKYTEDNKEFLKIKREKYRQKNRIQLARTSAMYRALRKQNNELQTSIFIFC